tara:strand:+ start:1736 stop:1951 length:216 start_codon:yes stop_codon:yes gene_type:complete
MAGNKTRATQDIDAFRDGDTSFGSGTKTSSIPGVKYTGSGNDKAVNKLLEKLKKDGADSLDSSGMGTRWKV